MAQTGTTYRCNHCGQEIQVTKGTSADLTLICCGEDMEKLEEN